MLLGMAAVVAAAAILWQAIDAIAADAHPWRWVAYGLAGATLPLAAGGGVVIFIGFAQMMG